MMVAICVAAGACVPSTFVIELGNMRFNDRLRPDLAPLESPRQTQASLPARNFSPFDRPTELVSTLHEDLPGRLVAPLRHSDCYWAPQGRAFRLSWELLAEPVLLNGRVCTATRVASGCSPSFGDPITRVGFRCRSQDTPLMLNNASFANDWQDVFRDVINGFGVNVCPPEATRPPNPFNECRSETPHVNCDWRAGNSLVRSSRHRNYPFCQIGNAIELPVGDSSLHFHGYGLKGPSGEASLDMAIKPTVKIVGMHNGRWINGTLVRPMAQSVIASVNPDPTDPTVRTYRPIPDDESEWHWNVTNPAGQLAGPEDRWKENFSPDIVIHQVRFFVLDPTAIGGRRYLPPVSLERFDMLTGGERDNISQAWLRRPIITSDCRPAPGTDRIVAITGRNDDTNCPQLTTSTPAYVKGCTSDASDSCNAGYLRWVARFKRATLDTARDPTRLRARKVDGLEIGEIPMIEFLLVPPEAAPGAQTAFAELSPEAYNLTPFARPEIPDPYGSGLIKAGIEIERTPLTLTVNVGAEPITLDGLDIAGDHPLDFNLRVEGATSQQALPARGTFGVRVIFRPLGPGFRSADLSIDLRRGSETLRVTSRVYGFAGQSELGVLSSNSPVTQLDVPYPRLLLPPYAGEATLPIGLVNVGTYPDSVRRIYMEGPDAAAFRLFDTAGNLLPPLFTIYDIPLWAHRNNTYSFDMKFTPTQGVRDYQATLVVAGSGFRGRYPVTARPTPLFGASTHRIRLRGGS